MDESVRQTVGPVGFSVVLLNLWNERRFRRVWIELDTAGEAGVQKESKEKKRNKQQVRKRNDGGRENKVGSDRNVDDITTTTTTHMVKFPGITVRLFP